MRNLLLFSANSGKDGYLLVNVHGVHREPSNQVKRLMYEE